MQNELLPHNLTEFRERFAFHDAVIHHVEFDLFTKAIKANPYAVSIVVGARDLNQERELGQGAGLRWINLTFEVEEVTRFLLRKPDNYRFAIMDDLGIGFFADGFFLDFFPMRLHSTEPDDFDEVLKYQGPVFIVVGRRCFWHVSPYRDRGIDRG